jgi:hypothetical protein
MWQVAAVAEFGKITQLLSKEKEGNNKKSPQSDRHIYMSQLQTSHNVASYFHRILVCKN